MSGRQTHPPSADGAPPAHADPTSPPPRDLAAATRARQQAALAALGVRALAGLSLEALLDDAVGVAAEELAVELVKVVALLDDGRSARLEAGVGWRDGLVGTATLAVGPQSQAGFALAARAPVVVEDLATDPRFDAPALLREHGVVSGVSVILHGAGERPYGVLGVHTRRRRVFSPDDVNFLQGVANVISAGMQRRAVEVALRRARDESQAALVQLEAQATALELQSVQARRLSDELERANARLARLADEAGEARDAAERARQQSVAILDSLTDAVSTYDGDWRCTYLNPSARELLRRLGFEPETVLGRVVWELVPALHDARIGAEARRCVAEGRIGEFVEFVHGPDRWLETRVVPGRDGRITAYSRDITERHQALVADQTAATRARQLLRVAAALSEAASPDEVAEVIFREGIAAAGADAGALALVHSDAGAPVECEIVRTHGYAEPLISAYRCFPVAGGRPLSDAILTRRPILLTSLAEWRRHYPDTGHTMEGSGYEAFAAIPVVSGERVLAAISVSFRDAVQFDEATRTFLATLGEQCGLALARAEAFATERRARETSAFLAEASRLLAASLDYEATLRAVAEAAVPRLGDWCAVDVIEEPTLGEWPPRVQRLAVVHQDPAMIALGAELTARYPTDWSSGTGLAAVLRDRRPLLVPHVTEALVTASARDERHLALLRALRFSAVIVVPLVARGLTLGALTLCMTESERRYDRADLALAEDLAQRAAIAVDNARLFREAAAARAAAEEANRGKGQFLATMSHELRTPLNAIAGHVQLLELGIHGPVTDEQREALQRVDRAQHHLLGLINDVLNYARIESGRVEYHLAPVDLVELVGEVRPLVAPLLAAKGLRFDVRLPDDGARPHARADRDKLLQIVLNLLSNAIKFTAAERDGAPGVIRLDVAAADAADGAGGSDAVLLRVTDTGMGIPADKLDVVFEPFVQVRGGFAREAGGTGLGLAISRDLARGMGGDLHAASTVDEGSVFTLVLPHADDGHPAPAAG